MLAQLKTIRKNGHETFSNGVNLLDFWAWAHSDIMGNAERGKLAEYIVTMAFGVHNGTRTEWDSYDLLTNEGIKIEVKSSGYIQTWVQKSFPILCLELNLPSIGIKKTIRMIPVQKGKQIYIFFVCITIKKKRRPIHLTLLNGIFMYYVQKH